MREIVDGLGGRMQGVPREDGFEITVASEIMAILCLSKDIFDLKDKVASIIVGYTYDDQPVTVADLKIQGAVAAVLKDALKPNLAQTLEHTPAFIHGGPFANIAHGLQFHHGDQNGTQAGRYRGHRSRLRGGSWR